MPSPVLPPEAIEAAARQLRKRFRRWGVSGDGTPTAEAMLTDALPALYEQWAAPVRALEEIAALPTERPVERNGVPFTSLVLVGEARVLARAALDAMKGSGKDA